MYQEMMEILIFRLSQEENESTDLAWVGVNILFYDKTLQFKLLVSNVQWFVFWLLRCVLRAKWLEFVTMTKKNVIGKLVYN